MAMRDGMLVVEVDVNEWAEVESEQMIVVVDEVEVMAKMEGGMLLVDQRSMEESGQPQVMVVVDDAVLAPISKFLASSPPPFET